MNRTKNARPDFRERRVSGKTAFRGNIIEVQTDEVMLPDGKTAAREVARHPGAAAIVPLLEPETVLLVWQYRYAPGRHLLEFPAGKLDAGESPESAAARELLEETGYRARRWSPILTAETSPGFCDERVFLYLARELEYEGHSGEAGEFVAPEKTPLSRALRMIADGEITDAKTILGLLWLRQNLSAP